MEEKAVKAKELCEHLLSLLEVSGTVSVSSVDEYLHLDIETEDAGLLIGRAGQTLDAFEIILSLMFIKNDPEGPRLSVDVSSFRKKREEELTMLARDLVRKVVETGQSQEIANLSARERRVVHLSLSNDEAILTESVGEGESRVLIIKKR